MHDISGRRCAHLTKSLHQIGIEVSKVPTFNGLFDIQEFLQDYEAQIPLSQQLKKLDVALRSTLARWWTMHKTNITNSETCHRLLAVRFGNDVEGINYRYDGQTDPMIDMEACVKAWQHRDVDEWVHLFVHTLDTIPKNQYTETELRKGIKTWSLMRDGFQLTFGFESEYLEIDDALEVIKIKLFDDCPLPIFNQSDWAAQIENAVECYNFVADEEEEDPHNANILALEGSQDFQGLKLELPEITEKVKIKKINIGTKEYPKFASIGDYWDDETCWVKLITQYLIVKLGVL